jgi:predicted HAD superfamily Cof-like phosphohydrolase
MQQMVLDFHKEMGLSIGDPRDPDITVDQDLRVGLIAEEFQELKDALFAGDEIAVADALGDILYTVAGAGVSWGIDLGPIFDEIHFSNMTKKRGNMREDGKILKDADYKAPKIALVMKQSAQEFTQAFHNEDNSGWPLPEVEPSPEVSKKIMTAAIMKTIREDFVPGVKSVDNKTYTIVPEELDDLFDDSQPTQTAAPKMRVGHMTNYGAYVFSCVDCDRTHAASSKLGSRGGMAPSAEVECMCGRAYVVTFSPTEEPKVEITTVEDLRGR